MSEQGQAAPDVGCPAGFRTEIPAITLVFINSRLQPTLCVLGRRVQQAAGERPEPVHIFKCRDESD